MQARQSAIEDRVIRKISWRVGMILMALFLFSIVDRSNIGFAKLQMVHALHLSEAAFALASSVFFFTYTLVELPSATAVHRFGARLWFTRIVLTWGLVTVGMAWVGSETALWVLRLLLGVAEGGLYPGILFVITLWFPQRHRARAVGLLTLGSAIGNALSAMISGPLLDLNGLLGFAGWQWVFIATGIPAILMTVVVLTGLPDDPQAANFLSADEKAWLSAELAADAPATSSHPKLLHTLLNPRVAVLALVYMLINTSLFGLIYWLPTIVNTFGVTGTQNGLLNAIPWTIAGIVLLWLPRRLTTMTAVLRAAILLCGLGLVCFLASTTLPTATMRFAALAIGVPCISLLYPCFWSIPPRYFEGAQAAAAIAMITTLGGLGGFFSQNLFPWVAGLFGHPVAAMIVPSVCLGVIGLAAALSTAPARAADGATGLSVRP